LTLFRERRRILLRPDRGGGSYLFEVALDGADKRP